MKMFLKRNWEAVDGNTGLKQTIPAGEHEVEKISCPLGWPCNWIVLKDTKVGASEGSWLQWTDAKINWGEFFVILIGDDGKQILPTV
jgi:hypothetical protein